MIILLSLYRTTMSRCEADEFPEQELFFGEEEDAPVNLEEAEYMRFSHCEEYSLYTSLFLSEFQQIVECGLLPVDLENFSCRFEHPRAVVEFSELGTGNNSSSGKMVLVFALSLSADVPLQLENCSGIFDSRVRDLVVEKLRTYVYDPHHGLILRLATMASISYEKASSLLYEKQYDLGSALEVALDLPNSERGCVDAKNNFLYSLLVETANLYRTKRRYCMFCQGILPVEMPKLSVCDKPLCLFGSESFGFGVDLTVDRKVGNLLLDFAYSASSSGRLDPYPSALFPAGEEQQVCNILSAVPRDYDIDDYYAVSQQTLSSPLPEEGKRRLHLFRWVLATNRSHITHVEDNENPYFSIVANPPEKEAKFQELKSLYGSIQVYHGSPLFNNFLSATADKSSTGIPSSALASRTTAAPTTC